MSKQAASFALEILSAAVKAHQMHWATRSYAQHVALGDFYGELPDLVDGVVEQYQGLYGLIPGPKEDPVSFIQGLASYIKSNRDFCDDSELQNQIDNIASLCDSTLYKLKFLS